MPGHVCPWWMAYTFDHPGRRLLHNPERILRPYVKPGMTAMDVGCGMGFFAIAMAGMIGPEGRVIAVDLQPQMLDVLRRRAERRGLADRICSHRCEADRLGVRDEVDFALAFYVIHEVADRPALLRQVRACLAPTGRVLVVEPFVHVSRRRFDAIIEAACAAGLRLSARPRVRLSRAALFDAAR